MDHIALDHCLANDRPFALGMLYDSRSEQLIPGICLWNLSVIAKNTCCTTPENTIKFDVGYTLSSAPESLVVYSFDTSINDFVIQRSTTNMCGNLFEKKTFSDTGNAAALLHSEPERFAKFVSNRARNSKQARIVLSYSSTTQKQQLAQNFLKSGPVETYRKQIIRGDFATHVVVGIDYGADARFVFDSLAASEAERKLSCDSLQVKLRKCCAAVPESSAKWDSDDDILAHRFGLCYTGDFLFPDCPVTVKSALETFASLPSLLEQNKQFATPKVVHLLPLTYFDKSAARMVHEISQSVRDKCIEVYEVLVEQQRETNEILAEFPVTHKFSGFECKINEFVDNVERYRQTFYKKLTELLPKIRGGEESEQVLESLLEQHSRSAFCGEKCSAWIVALRKDILLVDELMKQLRMFKFEKFDNVYAYDSKQKFVCFVVTISGQDDFLQQLQATLDKG